MEFLKKEEYERKLNRRRIALRTALGAIIVLLIIGWLVAGWKATDILVEVEVPMWILCFNEFSLALGAGTMWIIYVVISKIDELERRDEEELSDFEFKLEEEEFFRYLGDRRIKLKLKLNLEEASKEFEDTVQNPKINWYVEKHGQYELYLVAYKGKKRIFHEVVDYEFLELYFEEKVKHSSVTKNQH